jgi:hypothetical protein
MELTKFRGKWNIKKSFTTLLNFFFFFLFEHK